jgi:3-hydroxyisobutyrate dehydrogenase
MGLPMAARLLHAGYSVTVRDIHPAAVHRWEAEHGAQPAAGSADAVVLMLPSSAAVEAVLSPPQAGSAGSLWKELSPDAVIVDMGSSEPESSVQMAALAAERGFGFVDAPVTGGVTGARSGKLTIMIGGSDADVGRVWPVLTVLGATLHRTGKVATGHAMKALNNMVSAAGMLMTAEALTAGVRAGLDPAVMVSVLNGGSGRSYASEWKVPKFVLTGSFDSGFLLSLMVKDTKTAVRFAAGSGTPAAFMEICSEIWARAASELSEDSDHTELIEWVARQGGVSLVQRPEMDTPPAPD